MNLKKVVWTKDPTDLHTTGGQHSECAKTLEAFGFQVLFRSGTHEKAVILDNRTAYYGSLNPLSHRDTKETMLRVDNAAFAKALVDHLELDEQASKHGEDEATGNSTERIFKKLGITPGQVIDNEKARKAFKKLRWVIAQDKGLPMMSTLWNRTIDWLLEEKPTAREKLVECEEFRRNRSNIAGYENIVLGVLKLIR